MSHFPRLVMGRTDSKYYFKEDEEVLEERARNMVKQKGGEQVKNLSLYDMNRDPLEADNGERARSVPLSWVREELTCPICMSVVKETYATMMCVHRFCKECILTSLRLGKKEPTCREPCPTRRNLRADMGFDSLVEALYPERQQLDAKEERSIQQVSRSFDTEGMKKRFREGVARQQAAYERDVRSGAVKALDDKDDDGEDEEDETEKKEEKEEQLSSSSESSSDLEQLKAKRKRKPPVPRHQQPAQEDAEEKATGRATKKKKRAAQRSALDSPKPRFQSKKPKIPGKLRRDAERELPPRLRLALLRMKGAAELVEFQLPEMVVPRIAAAEVLCALVGLNSGVPVEQVELCGKSVFDDRLVVADRSMRLVDVYTQPWSAGKGGFMELYYRKKEAEREDAPVLDPAPMPPAN